MHDILALLAAKKLGWMHLIPFVGMVAANKNEQKKEGDMPSLQINGQRLVEAAIIGLIPAAIMYGVLQTTVAHLTDSMNEMKTEMKAEISELKNAVNGFDKAEYDSMKAAFHELDKRLFVLGNKGKK